MFCILHAINNFLCIDRYHGLWKWCNDNVRVLFLVASIYAEWTDNWAPGRCESTVKSLLSNVRHVLATYMYEGLEDLSYRSDDPRSILVSMPELSLRQWSEARQAARLVTPPLDEKWVISKHSPSDGRLTQVFLPGWGGSWRNRRLPERTSNSLKLPSFYCQFRTWVACIIYVTEIVI